MGAFFRRGCLLPVGVLHPSELRSLRSLRTLPPYPASLLRKNLSPADPTRSPWPRVATSSGCSTPPDSAAAAIILTHP